MGKLDNHILAVPSSDVESITSDALNNGGLKIFDTNQQYNEILKFGITEKRKTLEEDSNYKQIIPYLVITSGDKVFWYVRASGSSEKKLHSKLSIGVGGHIELEDLESAEETIKTTLHREITEEIGEVSLQNLQPLGFIYTENSDVDTYHLGILFHAQVKDSHIHAREEEIGDFGFSTKSEMDTMMGDNKTYSPENWSKIAWSMVRELI